MKLGAGIGLSTSVNHLFDIIPSINVKRWYAADLVKVDMGNNISIAYDKSGNKGDATQSVGSAQPSLKNNGGSSFDKRPVMQFNGSTHFLEIADFDYVDYNNLNVFIVAKSDDFASTRYLMTHADLVNEAAWAFFINSTTKMRMLISDTGNGFQKTTDNSTVLSTTNAYLFSLNFDTTNLFNFLNGVDESTIIANNAMADFFDSSVNLLIGALLIGGVPAAFWDGDIAEIIITSNLTTTQITAVNAFLMNKYQPS